MIAVPGDTRLVFLVGLLGLVGLLTASAGSETPQAEVATTHSAANFDTCTGFLELEEVREVVGRTDITLAEPNVNSGLQEPSDSGITAMCVIEYITPEIPIGESRISGPALTITAIAFDSAQGALAHQETVLQGVNAMRESVGSQSDVIEGVLGSESYSFTADAEGVGSLFGFLVGPHVIQLRTTLPNGATPLVDSSQLQLLAQTIRANLGVMGDTGTGRSDSLPYLFAAYAVTWVVFLVYVFFVSRHQREMQRDIEELRQAVQVRENPEEP